MLRCRRDRTVPYAPEARAHQYSTFSYLSGSALRPAPHLLSTLTGARIELFNTDGALGAARGAALGAGYYKTRGEAFAALRRLEVVEPAEADRETLEEGYRAWVREVEKRME